MRRFTEAEKHLVIQWSLAGLPVIDQAQRLGRRANVLSRLRSELIAVGRLPPRPRYLTEGDKQHLIAWADSDLTIAEQARSLGVSINQVRGFRRQSIRAGTIASRHPTRPWTRADLDMLEQLIDDGHSYAGIATRLQRTTSAVTMHAKRIDYPHRRAPTILTAADVRQLLGVGCTKTVINWCKRGWLPAQSYQDYRTYWHIRLDDLYTFLENRAYWMTWEPEHITDTELRAWATALRRGQPRWLMPHEVAQHYHVSRDTIRGWVHKGWLKAVFYRNYWIWSADLEQFTPPSRRPMTTHSLECKKSLLKQHRRELWTHHVSPY